MEHAVANDRVEQRGDRTLTHVTGDASMPPGLDISLAPSTQLGPYRLLEPLGVGGMGAVFRARDRRHARDVALKVVSPELAGDPVFEERFEREARTLGQLDHPNIVRVFDSGRRGPWLFLVMEYVDGVDLRRWMDLGDFHADAALGLLPALCEALRHAHERGVVHRDVKPENILIDQSGTVKLADFGLAKLAGEADWGVTRTNQALGTLHYMAPEQLEGASSVDHRADIFSLGVVVYEMLTGQLPHGRFELPSQKQPSLRGVDRAVLRSMERDPSKRYQSAAEFERDVLVVLGSAYREVGNTLAIRPRSEMAVVIYDPGVFDQQFSQMFGFRAAGFRVLVLRAVDFFALVLRGVDFFAPDAARRAPRLAVAPPLSSFLLLLATPPLQETPLRDHLSNNQLTRHQTTSSDT